jgi:dCTP diphosphatase
LSDFKKIVEEFTKDREWTQFHSLKTLSQALSIESSELMELFLWDDNETSKLTLYNKRELVEHEMADIFWRLLQLSWQYNIDLTEVLKKKMEINKKRYPVEKAKGNTKKYTTLEEEKI